MRLNGYYLIAVVLTLLFPGCTKNEADTAWKNSEIGFPLASNTKNDYILRPSGSTQQVSGLLSVKLEGSQPASSAVHIGIADNTTALLNQYNTINGTFIQALPASLWSMPSELVINAGQTTAQANITVTNTSGLNFNAQYAIGVRIVNISTGNPIATNTSNLFIVFRIQNAYDGKYKMVGQFLHPIQEPNFAHHVFDVELHTTTDNSVKLYWPHTGFYNLPLTVQGNATCCMSSEELTINIDPVTNAANCVSTCPPCSYTFSPISSYNNNTYTNRWDPNTQTLYAAFGYYLSPTNTIVFGSSRAWIDTLIYVGPR